MSLRSSPGSSRQPPRRASLKGSPLPDLTAMNLADASHRVVAEGFSLDELDAQMRQLTK